MQIETKRTRFTLLKLLSEAYKTYGIKKKKVTKYTLEE